jgi:hypothetical protein
MARTRSPSLTGRLPTALREIQHATHSSPKTPSLDQLREDGWHLIHLTGALAALLAEHTGTHTTHPDRLREVDGNDVPAAHLGRACRHLAELRRAADTAQAAARDYYTTLSHLTGDPPQTGQPR